jgi:hypothetical protein
MSPGRQLTLEEPQALAAWTRVHGSSVYLTRHSRKRERGSCQVAEAAHRESVRLRRRLLRRDRGCRRVTVNQLSRFGCGSARNATAGRRGRRARRGSWRAPCCGTVVCARCIAGRADAKIRKRSRFRSDGRFSRARRSDCCRRQGLLASERGAQDEGGESRKDRGRQGIFSHFHQVTSTRERAKEHAGTVRTCPLGLTASHAEFGSELTFFYPSTEWEWPTRSSADAERRAACG